MAKQIDETLARPYWGPSSFMGIFRETPDQAITALETKPEVFGRLRTYLGPLSVEAARKKLVRLAQRLQGTLP